VPILPSLDSKGGGGAAADSSQLGGCDSGPAEVKLAPNGETLKKRNGHKPFPVNAVQGLHDVRKLSILTL
jgi:hypothetical protein